MKRTWTPRTSAVQPHAGANSASSTSTVDKSKFLEANAEDDGLGWAMSDTPMDTMYTIKRREHEVKASSQASFLDRVRQGNTADGASPKHVQQLGHGTPPPATQPKTNPFSRIRDQSAETSVVEEPSKKKHKSKDKKGSSKHAKKDKSDKKDKKLKKTENETDS